MQTNKVFILVLLFLITMSQNTIGAPVQEFFDDFETSQGWVRNYYGTDNATTGVWERANPQETIYGVPMQLGTTVSGVNGLITGPLAGSSAGSYDLDGGITTMRSPAITLPAGADITLSFSYYFAHYSNATDEDFLQVKIVGSTTQLVFQEVGSNIADMAMWETFSTNINSFAGQTINILIEAADGAGASLVEAAIDDILITSETTGPTAGWKINDQGSGDVTIYTYDRVSIGDYMYIDPSLKLHVSGGDLKVGYDEDYSLQLGANASDGSWIKSSVIDKPLVFHLTSNDVGLYEVARFQNGRLGIGTTTPDPFSKLDVNGKIKAQDLELVNGLNVKDLEILDDEETPELVLKSKFGDDEGIVAKLYNNKSPGVAGQIKGELILQSGLIGGEIEERVKLTTDGLSLIKLGIQTQTIKFEEGGDLEKNNLAYFKTSLYNDQTLGDGFRLRFDEDFEDNDGSKDVLIIEKTDGNQGQPDGGIAFMNTGYDEGTQQVTSEVAMYIEGSGRVGIGTTEPKTMLHVKRLSEDQPTVLVEQTSGHPNIALSDGTKGMRFEFNRNDNEIRVQTCDAEGEYISLAATITSDGTVSANTFKVGEWVIKEAPDYVFNKDYYLKPLKEVEQFINKNKHLPEVPSAKEIKEEGIDLVKMNMTLLKKIEELTLYTIEQNKKIEKLEKAMSVLTKGEAK